MKTFEDILYEEREGVAHVTINRPKVYNAFRAQTVEELIEAIKNAGWNRDIGVIVLGGVGDKEPLLTDPVNVWTWTLILAVALDLGAAVSSARSRKK